MKAEVITLQRRRHLDTAMARYSVEVMLIALVAAAKATVQPEAGFDCTSADQMISLFR